MEVAPCNGLRRQPGNWLRITITIFLCFGFAIMFWGRLGQVPQPKPMFSSLKWECWTGVICIRQFRDYLCVLSRPANLPHLSWKSPQVLCYKLRTGLPEEWQSGLQLPLYSKVWFLSEKKNRFFPLTNWYSWLMRVWDFFFFCIFVCTSTWQWLWVPH